MTVTAINPLIRFALDVRDLGGTVCYDEESPSSSEYFRVTVPGVTGWFRVSLSTKDFVTLVPRQGKFPQHVWGGFASFSSLGLALVFLGHPEIAKIYVRS